MNNEKKMVSGERSCKRLLATLLSSLSLFVWLSIAMTIAGTISAPCAAVPSVTPSPLKTGKPDVRTFHFPAKSIGILLLMTHPQSQLYRWHNRSSGQQVAGAAGDVKITVPAEHVLQLDTNRRVFENPELLDALPATGIEMLKLNFISLDDKEDGMCDRALGHISHMTGLKLLNVDRSEATDAGLSKVKTLPHLEAITCFMSSIDGSCFKDLAALPELSCLSAPKCSIASKNLVYLAKFPRLIVLELDRTHLDLTGAQSIGKCLGLRELTLRGNQTFDDQCLRCLVPLKKLENLDVAETAVTAKGFECFRGAKIKRINVSASLLPYKRLLETILPDTHFDFQARGQLKEDEKVLYSPLR